jgi:hypothetical protein
MAETLVENQVCNHCGADIRPAALFCYHCGSSVAPEVVVALKDKKNISPAWLQKKTAEDKNGNRGGKIGQLINQEVADKPLAKQNLQSETSLRSAAAMRRNPKQLNRKELKSFGKNTKTPRMNGLFSQQFC